MLAQGGAGKRPAAARRRSLGRRGHRSSGRMAGAAPRRARDRVPFYPGADAGFLRLAAAWRPRCDARRDDSPRWRPEAAQSVGAGGPDRGPFGDGGCLRRGGCGGPQPGARDAAQCRALRLSALGRTGVRQLAHRAAGQGHLPPDQPRISCARGVDERQGRPEWEKAGRLPGFGPRHGQPHGDDQQPRRSGLGRRRSRRRRRRIGRVGLDAGAGSHRLPAHGQAASRRHLDRPRAHDHADPAPAQAGGQVRRVFRPRRRRALAARPRHDCQHEPGERRHHGLFPGGCGDAALSAADRQG